MRIASTNPNPVITAVSPNMDYATGVAIQPDGSVVAVGRLLTNPRSPSWNAFILRYTPGGALDSSFGSSGIATVGNNTSYYANAIYPTSSPTHPGEIVAAGGFAKSWNSSGGNFFVALYNSSGALDTTFGSKGTVQTTIGSNSTVYGVAIQPDGKIIAVGTAASNSATEVAVARYNPNGTLDTTFGSGGIVTWRSDPNDPNSNDDEAKAVAIQVVNGQTDIVVVGSSKTFEGYTSSGTPIYRNACLEMRFGHNGNLDPTFGTGGVVKTILPSPYGNSAVSVVIQPDNRIVVGDTEVVYEAATNTDDEALAMSRYNVDGSLDTTFGDIDPSTGLPSGIVTTDLGLDYETAAVGLQSTGKIVLIGESRLDSGANSVFARYTSSGKLDNSVNDPTAPFGPTGSGSVAITARDGADALSGAVQASNDAIVGVGYVFTTNQEQGSTDDTMAARVTSEGLIDPTF